MGDEAYDLVRRAEQGGPPVAAPPAATATVADGRRPGERLLLAWQQQAGNRAVGQRVGGGGGGGGAGGGGGGGARPPTAAERREFVEEAIRFLDGAAQHVQAGARVDEARLRRMLASFRRIVDNAERIVVDHLGGQPALLHRLRTTYARAVDTLVPAAGGQLGRLRTTLYTEAAARGDLHPSAIPADPVADRRLNILPQDEQHYTALVAFFRSEVTAFDAAVAQPPANSWIRDNPHAPRLLGIVRALLAELDARSLRIRFAAFEPGVFGSWDVPTDTMRLRPLATGRGGRPQPDALRAAAVTLLHEYVHTRQDRAIEGRLAGGQRDVSLTTTQDLDQEVEAFSIEAYWTQWIVSRHSRALRPEPRRRTPAQVALGNSRQYFLRLERARAHDAAGQTVEAADERNRVTSSVHLTYMMRGPLPSPIRYFRIDFRIGSTSSWIPVLTLVDGTQVELRRIPPFEITEQFPTAVGDHLLAAVVNSAPYRTGRMATPVGGGPPKTYLCVVFLRGRPVGSLAVAAPQTVQPQQQQQQPQQQPQQQLAVPPPPARAPALAPAPRQPQPQR